MRSEGSSANPTNDDAREPRAKGLPKPTMAFRRRAWVQFQRAIDPLAPPKALRIGRR